MRQPAEEEEHNGGDGPKEKALKGAFIFSGLDDGELNELAGFSTLRRFAPDQFVFMEGDRPDYFYVVAEGQVRVVKHSSSGKEFVVAFFEAGDIFGEVAAFEDRPYPASAQATISLSAVAIPRGDFIDFLGERPRVALRIIDVLGGRLREAQSRLKDLAVERVEQRLANTLVMLYSKLGRTLPFTRQDIADMTGTTIETAIRTMARFKDSRIIATTRGRITVTDPDKLRLLAEGPPRLR